MSLFEQTSKSIIVNPLTLQQHVDGFPVKILPSNLRTVDLFFGRLDNFTTLTTQANPEDITVVLSDTTGFVDGTIVGIFSALDSTVFYLGTQLGAPVGSTIILDTPIDRVLQIGSSVAGVRANMNVDGSITPQRFQVGPVGPGSTQNVDVAILMGSMLATTAMDDSLFGNIAALTRGVVLRKHNTNIQNIWNVKTNGELALLCFDLRYNDKAGGGKFGLDFRNAYATGQGHGAVIRLEPGDFLEIIIQDDLTGLDSFKMLAQGTIG
jgi:hypothetical protein